MSKPNHKQMIKMARRMRTNDELKARVSIWDTVAWREHKLAIAKRHP